VLYLHEIEKERLFTFEVCLMSDLRVRHVVIVVLVCMVVRIMFFIIVQPWQPEVEKNVILQDDPSGYHRLATTLVNNHRFAVSETAALNTNRTPLYPAFIAINYWLFGERPWVVILSQILINSLTCLVLLFTLTRIFRPKVALIATYFFALDPNSILHSSLLYSEILLVFFLVIGFYLFSTALLSSSPKTTACYYILYAISLGLGTLVRPISLYLPVAVIAFLLYWYRRQVVTGIKHSVIILFVFVLTISPWLIRNHNIYGSFSLSSIDSEVLLSYNVAYMEMPKRHQNIDTVRAELIAEAEEMRIADGLQPDATSPFIRAKYMKQLAVKYIEADPIDFMKRYCLGLFNIMFSPGTSMYSKALGLPAARLEVKSHTSLTELIKDFVTGKGIVHFLIAGIVLLFLGAAYISFIIGLMISWGKYHNGVLIFCLLSAGYLVLVGALTAYARFRLPPAPFVLPFIGVGFSYLINRFRIHKNLKAV